MAHANLKPATRARREALAQRKSDSLDDQRRHIVLRSIAELGQHDSGDSLLSVPPDQIRVPQRPPEACEQCPRQPWRKRHLFMQVDQHEQERPLRAFGTLPLNTEEIPERFFVVGIPMAAFDGKSARASPGRTTSAKQLLVLA